MSALDYILYGLLLVLLVVYFSIGRNEIREGYGSPTINIEQDDSDLVLFFKYLFFYASMIVYFVILWPSQIFTMIFNIPFMFSQNIFLALQPLLDMVLAMYAPISLMFSGGIATMAAFAKTMVATLTDIPGLISMFVMMFVNMTTSLGSMGTSLMAFPVQLLDILSEFGYIFMKIPNKAMEVLKSSMESMSTSLDSSTA